MINPIAKEIKLTQNEFYDLADDFVLDLIAFYKLLEEESMALINKAHRLGWNEDKLINEIGNLLE